MTELFLSEAIDYYDYIMMTSTKCKIKFDATCAFQSEASNFYSGNILMIYTLRLFFKDLHTASWEARIKIVLPECGNPGMPARFKSNSIYNIDSLSEFSFT